MARALYISSKFATARFSSQPSSGSDKPQGKQATVVDINTRRTKPDDADSPPSPPPSIRLSNRYGCPLCGCKDPDCLLTDLAGQVLACIKCGFGT